MDVDRRVFSLYSRAFQSEDEDKEKISSFPLFSRILRCKILSSNVCLPDTTKEVLYGEYCRQPNH